MIIREAQLEDAEAIAQVHVDTWLTTYQGIIPDNYIAKLSYQKQIEIEGVKLKEIAYGWIDTKVLIH